MFNYRILGWVPNASNALRRLIQPSRLSSNASIVALPVGEMPMSRKKSSVHWKWSSQLSFRGWYNGTSVNVIGSLAVLLIPLRPLQPLHEKAILPKSFVPLWTNAVIGSISKVSVLKFSGIWQYSQIPFARRATNSLSSCENFRRLALKFLQI